MVKKLKVNLNILKTFFLRFRPQTYFKSLISFSYTPPLKNSISAYALLSSNSGMLTTKILSKVVCTKMRLSFQSMFAASSAKNDLK